MKCPFELPVYKDKWDATPARCVREKDGHLLTGGLPNHKADYILQAINSHEKLVKHIEALKSICEKYIPTDKIDEANDEVILLSVGITEEIGRKLLAKQALKEAGESK